VAVYFLNLKTFGRSHGSSAVSAAAYRSGERLHDERTGRTYDHTGRQGVLHKEILLPEDVLGPGLDWTQDRQQLWNAAEQAETRRNARVAREYLVALPVELDPDQRLRLVRNFSRELVERYRFVLDVAVHAPRDYPDSDPRNFHAHLLATTREITPAGLAAKTTLEWGDGRRAEAGLRPAVHELFHVRERWAAVTNEALRDAHIDARVDHRTLAAQGIDREPYPRIPRVAFEMERHGYRSEQAERLRAEHAERVAARTEARAREAAASSGQEPAPPATSRRQTLEEIRRQAREDWLRMRDERRQAEARPAEERPAEARPAEARVAGPARDRFDDDQFSR
jgi:ATP-dependent exoDNAse (exonuclease V) alpha subunit